MNIVYLDADTTGDAPLDEIRGLGNLILYPHTKKEEILERAKEADIIICNKVELRQEILAELKRLKLISVVATGTNNIDVEWARARGIEVKNVVGYSTDSVVQHTFMIALALLGNLKYYENYVSSGKWSAGLIFTHIDGNFPLQDIAGMNFGILGLGTIGRRVGEVAECFGANVNYHSISGHKRKEKFKEVSNLDEFFTNNKVISIHAPLSDGSRNLVRRRQLEMLPSGSVLLNLGRGGIVNEEDLFNVIAHKDFYFGTDVLEVEPPSSRHPLLSEELRHKVLITPHVAWAYRESRIKLMQQTANNIKEFLER